MYNIVMKVYWFWTKQQNFERKRDDAGNNSNWHNKARTVHVQFSKCSYLSLGQIYCCITPCLVNVRYSIRSALDHTLHYMSYCIVMESRSPIAILCCSMLKICTVHRFIHPPEFRIVAWINSKVHLWIQVNFDVAFIICTVQCIYKFNLIL